VIVPNLRLIHQCQALLSRFIDECLLPSRQCQQELPFLSQRNILGSGNLTMNAESRIKLAGLFRLENIDVIIMEDDSQYRTSFHWLRFANPTNHPTHHPTHHPTCSPPYSPPCMLTTLLSYLSRSPTHQPIRSKTCFMRRVRTLVIRSMAYSTAYSTAYFMAYSIACFIHAPWHMLTRSLESTLHGSIPNSLPLPTKLPTKLPIELLIEHPTCFKIRFGRHNTRSTVLQTMLPT